MGTDAPIVPFQAVLGSVAGFVDTVSFVSLGGIFVSMVTGNIILLGGVLTGFEVERVIPNLLTIPVLFGAITLHALLRATRPFSALSKAARVRTLLWAQALLLAAFAILGTRLAAQDGFPLRSIRDIALVGSVGVFAMAIQNAFTRLVDSLAPPTTIMTGNVVQVAICLATLLSRRAEADQSVRQRARSQLAATLPALLGFFLGAVCAALLTHYWQFQALAIPCIGLLLLSTLPESRIALMP